ncbi:HTH-type transcriptional regulator [Rhynchospora pubera]|uniref:HTH-type transcriptional regulator n=1 Tax=Rhynchospora pubera TaxID=906938 RepID=A0AAV8G5Z4_9POAL|nr:HTH-type transcriptional regulator [Rhynchospora pubera]
MGLRFSYGNHKSTTTNNRPKVTTVIMPDGSVRELTTIVSASDPLFNADETHFLCNSDTLYFDSEVVAVGSDELLQPGQLYFMLPESMLGSTLSSADMAILAVKASTALAPSNPKRRTGNGGRRLQVGCSLEPNDENEKFNEKINEDTLRASGSRPSVGRRPVRRGSTSSRRPRVSRRRLSTIEETG